MSRDADILRAAALRYAVELGWAVFPVGRDCRAPLVKGGCRATSSEPADIARWWRRAANIALACGGRSGVFALDVDVKGDDGLTTLALLEDRHGALPQTWEAATPSGGRHLYFRQPALAMRNRVGFAAGLDVRTAGGSVALPPSRKPGGAYRWLRAPWDGEVADAPGWLLALIAPPEPPRPRYRPLPRARDRATRYAQAALDGECRRLAEMKADTGRNQRLFVAAAGLARFVGEGLLDAGDVEGALTAAAMACGLHKDDGGPRGIAATIASGLRRGLASPRSDVSPQLRALLRGGER